jgi:branched-chain amino acid transport system permease protein
MLGGAATLAGPAVGAVLYILMSEVFRVLLKSGHLLFFGILICVIIIFFPQGIVGTVREKLAGRRLRAAAASAAAAKEAA